MTKSEMVLSKTFSAQWLMAVIVTGVASAVTLIAVMTKSAYADTILAVFFTNWGIIITNYFKRDRTEDKVIAKDQSSAP